MMQSIRFREGNLFFSVKGKGRTVVLLHGFLEHSGIWDELAEQLSKRYKVVCIDLPGHGKSDSYGYIHTMEFMADCVKGVLDELKLRKFVLVGHSMGGYVALAFAENFPDHLKGMVLFHSTAAADSEERKADRERIVRIVKKNPGKYVTEAVKRLFAPQNTEKFQDRLRKVEEMAMGMSKQGIIDALEGMKIRNNREVVLKFVDYPVLFINGKNDLVIPYENIQHQLQLAHLTETLLLEESGHMGFYEEPEKTVKALRSFFRKCFSLKHQ